MARTGKLSSEGAAGGAAFSTFGFRIKPGVGTLVGTFYDDKQDRNGKPTNMASADAGGGVNEAEKGQNDTQLAEVRKLVRSGLGEGLLSAYFRAPDNLYATQIFIPQITSDQAPRAFAVQDKVKPKRWIALYKAKVTVPEAGNYRFVGFGDDFLVMRFAGRVVLDAGLNQVSEVKTHRTYFFDGLPSKNDPKTGKRDESTDAKEGEVFGVSPKSTYDIEVMFGEQPGGSFAAWILLEKVGAEYEKDSRGNPKFPIFKVGKSETPKSAAFMPAHGPDQPWSVWSAVNDGKANGSPTDAVKRK